MKSYNKNKDKFKRFKGITLISLVITIILLLILAGVTINGIFNNNGLFSKVINSKEETLKSQSLEELKLKVNEIQLEKKGQVSLKDIAISLKNDTENKYIVSVDSNSNEIYVIYKNYKFIIDNNFEISCINKIDNETGEIPKYGEKIEFDYTGNYQEYKIKESGYYRIQCWGANGGNSTRNGGKGALGGNGGYTSGVIYLEKGEKIYIYVGGHGEDAVAKKDSPNGYNGGGLGTWDHEDDEAAGAGGGATDIRLVANDWDNFESLKSRIMVAAGGGGATNLTAGGAGGGLEGLTNRTKSQPGTQKSGYQFGIGQDGYGTGDSNGVAGSGGGYYGGTTSNYSDNAEAGAGGSSYVSGYEGCNAISKDSTSENIIHTERSLHYSNKKFLYSVILDGNNSEIEPKNGLDGHATITFYGDKLKENIEYSKTEYNYTGNYQEYEVKETGYHKIQCWGADGGNSTTNGKTGALGGKGGYTSGIIYLEKGEKIYIYVGGHGVDAVAKKDSLNGYNGGGLGTWDHGDDEAAGAGGGATDIRLVANEWNNFESLKSRIMVAAGGGGATNRTAGGAGGGLEGLTNRKRSQPGTQISGYQFGIGQDGYGTGKSNGVAGSGGGYYGGTTSDYSDNAEAGAGGSSYVSGYEGCNAISKDSTSENIIHTGQSIHYSNKKFINGIILDGKNSKLSSKNINNGYARIAFLDNNYEVAILVDDMMK